MSLRRKAAVLALMTLAFGGALSDGAAADISYKTLFQDPGAGIVPDVSLEEHAIKLIDATPPGARIGFTFRDFNRPAITAALIAAHARGVDVDGVIDGGERDRQPVKDLIAAVGADNVVLCGAPDFTFHSCIASTERPSLMHNKFMTFSRLADGREHVVLQTSMNFFAPEQHHFYNDMVEITGDVALYEAYVAYLFQMKAQIRTDDNYLIRSGDDGRNTFFTSPRRQANRDTDDTIVDRMDEIDCSVGGSPSGRGLVRIAQLAFRTQRAVIMRKLVELHDDGCDIEVLASNLDGPILAGLVSAGIPVHPLLLRSIPGQRAEVVIHNKFWLVDAMSTTTGERTKITYAGSSNWRADQQRTDDLLLRMADEGVYADYMDYWELLHSRVSTDLPVPATDTLAPAIAIRTVPKPNAAGWNATDVTVRVAASDGVQRTGTSGLKTLHIELSGASSGSWERTGETDGYRLEQLPITAEGTTIVTAWAQDNKGNQSPVLTHEVRVDKTGPVVTGLPAGCELWPPDNRLVLVAGIGASDALSGVEPSSPFVTVASDAPDDFTDIVINGADLLLRAEKNATGSARTYTIVARVVDIAGNTTTASATCVVPHSQGVFGGA